MLISLDGEQSLDEEIQDSEDAARDFELNRQLLATWWMRRHVEPLEVTRAKQSIGEWTGPSFEAR